MATEIENAEYELTDATNAEIRWWDELWDYTKNEIIYVYDEKGPFSQLGKIVLRYNRETEPEYSYKMLDVSIAPKQARSLLYSNDPFLGKFQNVILDGNIEVDTNLFRITANNDGSRVIIDQVILMVFAYYYRKNNDIDEAIKKMKHFIECETRVYSNEDSVRRILYAESQKS